MISAALFCKGLTYTRSDRTACNQIVVLVRRVVGWLRSLLRSIPVFRRLTRGPFHRLMASTHFVTDVLPAIDHVVHAARRYAVRLLRSCTSHSYDNIPSLRTISRPRSLVYLAVSNCCCPCMFDRLCKNDRKFLCHSNSLQHNVGYTTFRHCHTEGP